MLNENKVATTTSKYERNKITHTTTKTTSATIFL